MEKKRIIIPEKITFEEKVKNFLKKIAILELKAENKQEIAITTKKYSTWDKLYWFEIFLSSSIATLGLIQNSVAVIIWAMLIAPLLRPINWVSLWISSGEKKALFISLKVLFLSILASIWMWYAFSFIVAIDIETSEILARTSPNILDFFIAIFSAFVAILSLQYSRLWESIAWVAMAASLLPPLAVVWIELYLCNFYLAWSSFMLFATNLFAIILIWIIIFILYWFSPHKVENQKIMMKNLFIVVIWILIISIPLFWSLVKIKENIIYKKDISNYLEKILKKENKNIEISYLEIEKNLKEKLEVKSVIKIPENVIFYKNLEENIVNSLSRKIGKDIDLKIELIRIANIISKENIIVDTNKQILIYSKDLIEKSYKNINLINILVEKKDWKKEIKIIYSINKKIILEKDYIKNIEKLILENFAQEKIIFNWLSLQEYNDWKEVKELKEIFTKQQELINSMQRENKKLQDDLVKKVEIEKNIVKLLKKYIDIKNKKIEEKIQKIEEK